MMNVGENRAQNGVRMLPESRNEVKNQNDDAGDVGRNSQEQGDPRPQEVATNSWYPPSVVSSPSSSHPATPNSTNSNTNIQRVGERPHVSPTEAAGIIVYLKDKR
ncbi:hypothetical protein E3N88_16850 [Mikania micrantha]|uniref:Uncharacterized protein n=1 Tax=Mikania micrantha TaxID=192012 RepID=A0A5N6NQR5_9ASTR|nr:hypothetical protein E3N88_16850 [Mikania micrantha]